MIGHWIMALMCSNVFLIKVATVQIAVHKVFHLEGREFVSTDMSHWCRVSELLSVCAFVRISEVNLSSLFEMALGNVIY